MFFRFLTAFSVPFLILFALVFPAFAFEEPAPGSMERKAILDSIRPAIEASLRGKVEFVVTALRREGDWAFAVLEPQRPGGASIDPAKTGHAGDIDFLDGLTTYALVLFRYGRWNLIDKVVGPMDAAFHPWPEIYGAPRSIFGM